MHVEEGNDNRAVVGKVFAVYEAFVRTALESASLQCFHKNP